MNLFLKLLMVLGFATNLQAQSVAVELGKKPQASFSLTAPKGLRKDTLVNASLNQYGKYKYKPQKDNLPGIWTLSVAQGLTLDFVWNGKENIVITENDIRNSMENDSVSNWLKTIMILEDKARLSAVGLQLYAGEKSKEAFFLTEKNKINKETEKFNKMTDRSELYAARYIDYRLAVPRYQQALLQEQPDKVASEQFHRYFTEQMDVAGLYTSGKWFEVLNMMLELYRKGDGLRQPGLYQKDFTSDMIYVLARTEQPEAFTALGNDLLLICEQFGWDNQRNELLSYLSSSSRITVPTPLMKKLFALKMTKIGEPAPEIILDNNEKLSSLGADKYLVMFFETGCGHCESELKELELHYPELKEKGVVVLTISADTDKMAYETASNTFPWMGFCDFKGLSGENFKNYGVVGTPTIFVIDKNGIITGCYARLADAHILN
jgi:peroxiredoxin